MAGQSKAGTFGVFISYSRRDRAIADAMVEKLTGRGFAVTVDRRDLPFGEKGQAELSELIHHAGIVHAIAFSADGRAWRPPYGTAQRDAAHRLR